MAADSHESLDEDYAPARGAAVYTVEIDGEAVLLDEDANRLHHLNHTATLLWRCFDGRVRITELAAEIAEELDLPPDQVVTDTLAVVRHLGAEGLLDGIDRAEPGEGSTP
jgi:hypothetical protein